MDVRGKAVLVETGWARHWAKEQYFEDHLYLTRDTAEYLRNSGAALVGIDSYNIDDIAVGRNQYPQHSDDCFVESSSYLLRDLRPVDVGAYGV
jgi:kynurenine formamidase